MFRRNWRLKRKIKHETDNSGESREFNLIYQCRNIYTFRQHNFFRFPPRTKYSVFVTNVVNAYLQVLKKKGLDVFPPPDATAYLENTESKHYVIEKVIYQVWGLFSKSFRFKRSKFNQSAGRFNIVFQAQEIYVGHQVSSWRAPEYPLVPFVICTCTSFFLSQVDYCLIQNSMCSSYVLDITEDSLFYSPDAASTRLVGSTPSSGWINNSNKITT